MVKKKALKKTPKIGKFYVVDDKSKVGKEIVETLKNIEKNLDEFGKRLDKLFNKFFQDLPF